MYDKLLKALGFDSKDITAIAKAVKDSKEDEIDLDELLTTYKATQRKLMENDPDLVTEVARKEKGKLLDIWTKEIRKEFGLEAADVKDKPFQDVIKLAKAESVKGTSKDLQTLEQENVDLKNKVKNFEEVEIPKVKSEVEVMKRNFKTGNKLQKKIPTADLRVPFETAEKTLRSDIAELYDLDLDDKEEILIYSKGSKLQAKSADGTKLLTLDDVVADVLKRNKYVKESNADDNDDGASGGKKNVQPDDASRSGGDKKPILPHMNKAQQHQETLKKEKEARAAVDKK